MMLDNGSLSRGAGESRTVGQRPLVTLKVCFSLYRRRVMMPSLITCRFEVLTLISSCLT